MTKTAVTNLVLLIKKKTWTDTVVHYLGRHIIYEIGVKFDWVLLKVIHFHVNSDVNS